MAHESQRRNEDELAATQMTFGEHLGELRKRVLRSLLASLVGLVAVFIYHEEVFALVTEPYRKVMMTMQEDPALVATGATQAFFAHVKVSFIIGLILTAPFWIYQLWMFIGAGLYGRERRIVYKFAPLCLLLFVAGVFFGFHVLIPLGLDYLLNFADKAMVRNLITIPEYLRFFTLLTLLLGLAFELPVVMLGLVKAGIMTPAQLREKRKWALILIFVMAALFTPPDPVTQVLLALPLVGLYQFGILLGWLSLGSSRPKVDWRQRWQFYRKVLIVALLVVLFWSPLQDLWIKEQARQNLYDAGEAETPPVTDIGRRLLGMDVLGAYRVHEEDPGGEGQVKQIWVLRAIRRCFVVTLSAQRVAFQVIDKPVAGRTGAWVEFQHYPQPRVTWRMEKQEAVRYDAFVPALLEALRAGDEAVRTEMRLQFELLSGTKPEGDDEAALDAFRTWYEKNVRGSLLQ